MSLTTGSPRTKATMTNLSTIWTNLRSNYAALTNDLDIRVGVVVRTAFFLRRYYTPGLDLFNTPSSEVNRNQLIVYS